MLFFQSIFCSNELKFSIHFNPFAGKKTYIRISLSLSLKVPRWKKRLLINVQKEHCENIFIQLFTRYQSGQERLFDYTNRERISSEYRATGRLIVMLIEK